MYGIAIEYVAEVLGTPPDPLGRGARHAILVRLPGYHRRLALMADVWRRTVDLFLFTSPEATRAALARDNWRTFAAAHPACRDAAPALLVSESRYGDLVVLLRGIGSPTNGGQGCWRDHLAATESSPLVSDVPAQSARLPAHRQPPPGERMDAQLRIPNSSRAATWHARWIVGEEQ